ncbi:MAG: hypothetical protein IJC15_01640 [Clostridia bacterium]|nr:hypothetical protein [Clostridia bacterium]
MIDVTADAERSHACSGTTKGLAKIKRKAKEKEKVCSVQTNHFLSFLS